MLKATNISAVVAGEISKLSSKEVLISINGHGVERFPLLIDRLHSRVLSVDFDDVTAKITVQGKEYQPIDNDTALKIVNFVEVNKDKNFIVHCAQGISRSAAVCMFVHLIYGHSLKENFWHVSHPNSHVLGKLILIRKRLDWLESTREPHSSIQ